MQVTIRPSSIGGTIQAPASKSSMQRACAAALLAKGQTLVHNPGKSNDDLAAMNVIRGLGADLEYLQNGDLKITSHGIDPQTDTLNCGESGLGIRMFTPIIALSDRPISIEGTGSLLTRPMDFFDEILPRLGVTVNSNGGRLPLRIRGPLKPGNIEIDGSMSSQFLTGMLMAYSASSASGVSIRVRNLKSRPYIDLTLKVMRDFGMKVPENRGYGEFYFSPDHRASPNPSREYSVEGDWSGGAFLLAAGAIAGKIKISGLDLHSTQADKAVLDALKKAGASLKADQAQIEIGPSTNPAGLNAFQFDATDCPDLFPPLVAMASYCKGISRISGARRLMHKESNRALTLMEEFARMGITIEWQDDLLAVTGGAGLRGAHTHSRHDHRIAMACAVAALGADSETTIEDAEAVEKSYPNFYEDLRSLGAGIHIIPSLLNTQ